MYAFKYSKNRIFRIHSGTSLKHIHKYIIRRYHHFLMKFYTCSILQITCIRYWGLFLLKSIYIIAMYLIFFIYFHFKFGLGLDSLNMSVWQNDAYDAYNTTFIGYDDVPVATEVSAQTTQFCS